MIFDLGDLLAAALALVSIVLTFRFRYKLGRTIERAEERADRAEEREEKALQLAHDANARALRSDERAERFEAEIRQDHIAEKREAFVSAYTSAMKTNSWVLRNGQRAYSNYGSRRAPDDEYEWHGFTDTLDRLKLFLGTSQDLIGPLDVAKAAYNSLEDPAPHEIQNLTTQVLALESQAELLREKVEETVEELELYFE